MRGSCLLSLLCPVSTCARPGLQPPSFQTDNTGVTLRDAELVCVAAFSGSFQGQLHPAASTFPTCGALKTEVPPPESTRTDLGDPGPRLLTPEPWM